MKPVFYIFVGILSVSVADKDLCPKNEVWSDCGSACPVTCEKPVRDPNIACPAVCKVGCVCAKGYLRNKNGTCVKEELCKEQKCPKNEIWNECISACPRTCEKPVLDPEVACPAVCKIGCDCAPGYLRNKDGDCVKEESCVVCPKGQKWSNCGSACPPTCEEPNPKVCILICLAKCVCEEGLLWNNASQSCVKPCECPPKPTTLPPPTTRSCKENEVWSECVSCKRTCENLSGSGICQGKCSPGCDCVPGTVRDKNNNCVDESSCIKCPGNHSTFNPCASACQKTCKYPLDRPCTKQCVARCECDDNLVWDNATNTCLASSECPEQECGENEIWNECGSACPANCDFPNGNPAVSCIDVCVPQCDCKPGYLRDVEGKCVPKHTCIVCPENEKYNNCSSACEPTCESIKDPEPIACPAVCVEQCECIEGYVKNKNNICIPKNELKCGKNAVFNSCASACPKTCEHPDLRPCIKICVAKCDCIQGYVWDNSTKSCVKLLSCPKSEQKCPAHEFWNECGSDCARSCQYPSGNPNIACPAVCVPKCDCDYGYLRNDVGKCVPAKSCAKCPKNEFWNDCASACPLTCKNKKPEACIEICESRCDCEKGFVRNDKGLCVEPENC